LGGEKAWGGGDQTFAGESHGPVAVQEKPRVTGVFKTMIAFTMSLKRQPTVGGGGGGGGWWVVGGGGCVCVVWVGGCLGWGVVFISRTPVLTVNSYFPPSERAEKFPNSGGPFPYHPTQTKSKPKTTKPTVEKGVKHLQVGYIWGRSRAYRSGEGTTTYSEASFV